MVCLQSCVLAGTTARINTGLRYISPVVMANLHCQLDEISKHYGNKPLGVYGSLSRKIQLFREDPL